eukprot:TRINITY_DN49449_c0_g1_i1.p1 TRINITY_DN49449_c0_g1~~TRINITY_DN49449_c0_g1_i1.p1  ORF type:complete len:1164 (-),score=254.95 TRINITY_DN49449_c0_g1_i1:45-3536(-)
MSVNQPAGPVESLVVPETSAGHSSEEAQLQESECEDDVPRSASSSLKEASKDSLDASSVTLQPPPRDRRRSSFVQQPNARGFQPQGSKGSSVDAVKGFEQIQHNWHNVCEVVKLGIQSAHIKVESSRQERNELKYVVDQLSVQVRGIKDKLVECEENLKTANFASKVKSKKEARSQQPSGNSTLGMMGGTQRWASLRSSRLSQVRASMVHRGTVDAAPKLLSVIENMAPRRQDSSNSLASGSDRTSNSDESNGGLTAEEREMLSKIGPLERRLVDAEKTLSVFKEKLEDAKKRSEKTLSQMDTMTTRVLEELEPHALKPKVQEVLNHEMKKLESAMQPKLEAILKVCEEQEAATMKELHATAAKVQELEVFRGQMQDQMLNVDEKLAEFAAALDGAGSSASMSFASKGDAEDERHDDAGNDDALGEEGQAASEENSVLHEAPMMLSEVPEEEVLEGVEEAAPNSSMGESASSEAEISTKDKLRRSRVKATVAKRLGPEAEASSSICVQCRAVFEDDAVTCRSCGFVRQTSPSEVEAEPVRRCSQCGHECEEGSSSCLRCGFRSMMSDVLKRLPGGASQGRSQHTSPSVTVPATAPSRAQADDLPSPAFSRKSTPQVEGASTPPFSRKTSEDSEYMSMRKLSSTPSESTPQALKKMARVRSGGGGGADKRILVLGGMLTSLQDEMSRHKAKLDQQLGDVSSEVSAMKGVIQKLQDDVQEGTELANRRHTDLDARLCANEAGDEATERALTAKMHELVDNIAARMAKEQQTLDRQLALVFPRLKREIREKKGSEGDGLTVSEARVFAFDARLDALESGLCQILGDQHPLLTARGAELGKDHRSPSPKTRAASPHVVDDGSRRYGLWRPCSGSSVARRPAPKPRVVPPLVRGATQEVPEVTPQTDATRIRQPDEPEAENPEEQIYLEAEFEPEGHDQTGGADLPLQVRGRRLHELLEQQAFLLAQATDATGLGPVDAPAEQTAFSTPEMEGAAASPWPSQITSEAAAVPSSPAPELLEEADEDEPDRDWPPAPCQAVFRSRMRPASHHRPRSCASVALQPEADETAAAEIIRPTTKQAPGGEADVSKLAATLASAKKEELAAAAGMLRGLPVTLEKWAVGDASAGAVMVKERPRPSTAKESSERPRSSKGRYGKAGEARPHTAGAR